MFWVASKSFWLIAAPTNLLLLTTALAAAWAAILNSKRAACVALLVASALLVGAFTPVGYWVAVPLEGRFPQWQASRNEAPTGVIVLGGESGERVTILAELALRYPHARLAYSGPGDAASIATLRRRFTALGGDINRLMIEARATNTFENAVYSKDMIMPGANERWLLVTSAMHMPRAVGCFRQAGFNVDAYPTQFTGGYRTYSRFISKMGSNSLALVDRATKEWIGLVIYRLMGKTDALFPAPRT